MHTFPNQKITGGCTFVNSFTTDNPSVCQGKIAEGGQYSVGTWNSQSKQCQTCIFNPYITVEDDPNSTSWFVIPDMDLIDY